MQERSLLCAPVFPVCWCMPGALGAAGSLWLWLNLGTRHAFQPQGCHLGVCGEFQNRACRSQEPGAKLPQPFKEAGNSAAPGPGMEFPGTSPMPCSGEGTRGHVRL